MKTSETNTTAKAESPLLGPTRKNVGCDDENFSSPKESRLRVLRGEASYFTINELTASATARREGIDNSPTESAYHLLHVLVEQLLDPIREAWGEPIVVSSGYRCPELNTLVGGAQHSHHLLGCAADLIAGNRADHRRLFKLIVQMQQTGQIRFTQLIWEGNGRWLHISYVPSDLCCQVIGS